MQSEHGEPLEKVKDGKIKQPTGKIFQIPLKHKKQRKSRANQKPECIVKEPSLVKQLMCVYMRMCVCIHIGAIQYWIFPWVLTLSPMTDKWCLICRLACPQGVLDGGDNGIGDGNDNARMNEGSRGIALTRWRDEQALQRGITYNVFLKANVSTDNK